jgi:hypothetical protein
MKLNTNKTRAISFCREANCHGFDYKLCESSTTSRKRIRDLRVLTDTKFHFHQEVDNICSHAVRLLGLIRTLSFSFSSLHSLLMLYSTLVRPTLPYAYVAWNSTTSSDACKLERIQQSLYLIVVIVFSVTRLQLW